MRTPILLAALLVASPVLADEPLRDGDRVVLLGSTVIEREQRYGYWEAALTSRFPERSIVFRNLGWSGDTVFGHARAGFGSVPDGFRNLKEHVTAVNPTLIVIAYGTNESFEGEAGLPRFLEGLDKLLEALAPTRARLLFLSPTRQEDLGRPLPDPTVANKNLALYRDALKKVAEKRQAPFLDLFAWQAKAGTTLLTDNGMHFTGYGYWRTASAIESGFGLKPVRWNVAIDLEKKSQSAEGTKLDEFQTSPLKFKLTDAALPTPPAPVDRPKDALLPEADRVLQVRGLSAGKYGLRIDGKAVTTADASAWAKGVQIDRGPEFDQVEKLREAIIDKNQQYFYRWRPQNETYLFGFRKKEQGQNAKEVAEFEPLVAKQEQVIAKLRVPLAHTYEILPSR